MGFLLIYITTAMILQSRLLQEKSNISFLKDAETPLVQWEFLRKNLALRGLVSSSRKISINA